MVSKPDTGQCISDDARSPRGWIVRFHIGLEWEIKHYSLKVWKHLANRHVLKIVGLIRGKRNITCKYVKPFSKMRILKMIRRNDRVNVYWLFWTQKCKHKKNARVIVIIKAKDMVATQFADKPLLCINSVIKIVVGPFLIGITHCCMLCFSYITIIYPMSIYIIFYISFTLPALNSTANMFHFSTANKNNGAECNVI